MTLHRLLCASLAAFLLVAAPARAADPPAAERAWTAAAPEVVSDLEAGRPLVVLVVVPLCSQTLIDCGSPSFGRDAGLATNLYWGALYGARRFMSRPASGFEPVFVGDPPPPAPPGVLERAVYRRRVAAAPLGVSGRDEVEQLVVLDAIRGDAIDAALERFYALSAEGGEIAFPDGEKLRRERVHAVGYAGHNRLMDGVAAALPSPTRGARGVPSFVLACDSEPWFDRTLRALGSQPLVLTRELMAPEGYAIHAVVDGLGRGDSPTLLRARVVASYARWQRIESRLAERVFAAPPAPLGGP